MGETVEVTEASVFEIDHVGVKAPQFSFARLDGADPTLGVEMASTGEVGCLGDDFEEALLKSMLSVGYRLPIRRVLLSLGPIESKAEMLPTIRKLVDLGVELHATKGTAAFLDNAGIPCAALQWPLDNVHPDAVDFIRDQEVDLVINIPKDDRPDELTNGYMIRRASVDFNVPLITNRQIAMRFVEAIARTDDVDAIPIKSWGEYAAL